MLILDEAAIFCQNTQGLFSILGIFVTAIKIFIPIALIVFGMIDMGKAVTNGKEDEIKKSLMTFIRRAIAAIVVFFIPTIVGVIMQLVNNSLTQDPGNATDVCGYDQCVKAVTGIGGKCTSIQ